MTQDLDQKSQVFIRVLLNHYHKVGSDKLLKYLPSSDAKAILALKTESKIPSAIFLQPIEQLELIHYSWLAEVIKKQPPLLQPFFIASLSKLKGNALSK